MASGRQQVPSVHYPVLWLILPVGEPFLGHFLTLLSSNRLSPKRPDPNEFYYKPDRPQIPQDAICLECAQWRHEDGKEEFDGEIHFSPNIDTVEGALVFRIQAENLSKTQIKRIPVRIKTAHVSSFERTRALVEMFSRRPGFGGKLSSKKTGLSSQRREHL